MHSWQRAGAAGWSFPMVSRQDTLHAHACRSVQRVHAEDPHPQCHRVQCLDRVDSIDGMRAQVPRQLMGIV